MSGTPDYSYRQVKTLRIGLCLQAVVIRNARNQSIHEREITSPKQWDGSVVYFELDALVELASSVLANRAEVRHKPNLFRKALHTNLTSPSKHEDDPEKVHSSDYNSLHMSVQDVQEIFEFIDGQRIEHSAFDREQYLKAAEYFRDV